VTGNAGGLFGMTHHHTVLS